MNANNRRKEFFQAMPFSSIPEELKNDSVGFDVQSYSTFAWLPVEKKSDAIASISWLTDKIEEDGEKYLCVAYSQECEMVSFSSWVKTGEFTNAHLMVSIPKQIFYEIFEPRCKQLLKNAVNPIKLVRFFLVNMPEVMK